VGGSAAGRTGVSKGRTKERKVEQCKGDRDGVGSTGGEEGERTRAARSSNNRKRGGQGR